MNLRRTPRLATIVALAAFLTGSNHCLVAAAMARSASPRVPACHAQAAPASHAGSGCCAGAPLPKGKDRDDSRAQLLPCCMASTLPGPAPALERGAGSPPIPEAVLAATPTPSAVVPTSRWNAPRAGSDPPSATACAPPAARAPPLA